MNEQSGELSSWEMVTVGDKGIPGGLLSFFRSWELVFRDFVILMFYL
jgi:hypothetical protein